MATDPTTAANTTAAAHASGGGPASAHADPAADTSADATAEASAGASDTHAPGDGVTVESVVEALLFSTDAAVSPGKIAQLLGVGDGSDVKRHIEHLNRRYEQHGASFRIQAIAKGYQMHTMPVYDRWVRKLVKVRSESRLSKAALETLAVVAYKQPVLRADIEAIRGVAVGDMLVRLRDMNLVRITGRAEDIGRPLLYGTTRKFLEVFGLRSLSDLPKLDEDSPDTIPPLKIAADDAGASDPPTGSADQCDPPEAREPSEPSDAPPGTEP